FSQDYRRMCQHLAIAQQRGYSQPLLEYLELQVLQGHQQFYRHKSPLLSQFLAFIVIDFPATVRQQWLSIAIAGALFLGSLMHNFSSYQKIPVLHHVLAFIVIDLPATVRQQWLSIAIAGALFLDSFMLMALLTAHFPELIHSLLSPTQLAKMENMYAPAQRQIGPMSLRNHQDDWAMFGFYIMNNIGIAFQ